MINITHKQGLFKLVTSDNKNMELTSWNEGDEINSFISSEQIYIPEKWTDTKILETYHEIEKTRVAELAELQRIEAEKEVINIKKNS